MSPLSQRRATRRLENTGQGGKTRWLSAGPAAATLSKPYRSTRARAIRLQRRGKKQLAASFIELTPIGPEPEVACTMNTGQTLEGRPFLLGARLSRPLVTVEASVFTAGSSSQSASGSRVARQGLSQVTVHPAHSRAIGPSVRLARSYVENQQHAPA